MGSTDRARWAERGEEVPKSSPGYGRHRDIRHLPPQSQGHQRSPDKKSCPSVPCLPPSVQTPTSAGFPHPCSHSHAPDERPAETSWMGKPARKSCLLALKKCSGNSSHHPARKPEQKKAALLKHSPVGVLLSLPHPKTSSICWPQEEGIPHSATSSEHARQPSHLPLKIRLLPEMGCRTTYRWDSVLCPDVVNPIGKNAIPHLMLEEAKRPYGGEAYLLPGR